MGIVSLKKKNKHFNKNSKLNNWFLKISFIIIDTNDHKNLIKSWTECSGVICQRRLVTLDVVECAPPNQYQSHSVHDVQYLMVFFPQRGESAAMSHLIDPQRLLQRQFGADFIPRRKAVVSWSFHFLSPNLIQYEVFVSFPCFKSLIESFSGKICPENLDKWALTKLYGEKIDSPIHAWLETNYLDFHFELDILPLS